MKLILKGDLDILGNFNVIQAMYMIFQSALDELSSKPYVNDKREISFTSNTNYLIGYNLKLVENKTTKTITFIIK